MPAITSPALIRSVLTASQTVQLADGVRYLLTSTTNCWIKLGLTASPPTAAVQTAGSTYLPANVPIEAFAGAGLSMLAVCRDTLDGFLTATPIVP